MKFQFKHQQFQADAAAAVCDIFKGQSFQSGKLTLSGDNELHIGTNAPIEISDDKLLQNLHDVQKRNGLPASEQLDGKNFSIEMETGIGKTYTYIKTMYELNKNYGWSKFIVVVPSVAIREGVKKTFEMTTEHFVEEYKEKIRCFVYNSKNLSTIQSFVGDMKIWAMIVNVQAFSSRSADARRMLHDLDEFQSRAPIDVIAQIRPIVIIDEPQSVEGTVAREKIKQFNPLMTLRYSATHKNLFNQVYRLDALDAYQQRLVKKISVKGIELRGDKSSGYLFFERVNLSRKNPTATLTFNHRGKNATKKITRKISTGDDLFKLSGGMEEYRNFIAAEIDGGANSIEFINGLKLFAGQVIGDVSEEIFRRIQIRETIQSHLEREAQLFSRGIKVLSLFFIDEVAKYRQYDDANNPVAGLYAKIFEEEYTAAVKDFDTSDADYQSYLESIAAQGTHAGYFSIDKKKRQVDGKIDDVDAYDLIMRDKERLLDFQTPVRFIFSHSTLREGWDNPNVFQICALKQSSSDVRRRQEVGRGMRLCINNCGERMDVAKIGEDVHNINILTVIANESYQTFAAGLQTEIREAVNRPLIVTQDFFIGKEISGRVVDEKLSNKIYNALILRKYLDNEEHLTEKFHDDSLNGALDFGTELATYCADIMKILGEVGGRFVIENARANNVTAKLDEEKLHTKNFLELWSRISPKRFYRVDGDNFTSSAIVNRAANALNLLNVPEGYFVVDSGTLNYNAEFDAEHHRAGNFQFVDVTNPPIDLLGKLVESTGLTRRDVTKILRSADKKIFTLIRRDADKFLRDAEKIINDSKVVDNADGISYTETGENFSIKIFSDVNLRGQLNVNAVETVKNLYDHLIYDSAGEKDFAAELDRADDVAVYVKLPPRFNIPTPYGNYNPDWAVVFREGAVDKIYFVVETKGSVDLNQLRGIELGKISCAKKYFDAVNYNVVKNFQELEEKRFTGDKDK